MLADQQRGLFHHQLKGGAKGCVYGVFAVSKCANRQGHYSSLCNCMISDIFYNNTIVCLTINNGVTNMLQIIIGVEKMKVFLFTPLKRGEQEHHKTHHTAKTKDIFQTFSYGICTTSRPNKFSNKNSSFLRTIFCLWENKPKNCSYSPRFTVHAQ